MVKLIAIEIRIDFHPLFWMACCSHEWLAAGQIISRDVPTQTEKRNQYLNKLITNILMKTTFHVKEKDLKLIKATERWKQDCDQK